MRRRDLIFPDPSLSIDEMIDQVLAHAPTWDELPAKSRETLIRAFDLRLPSVASAERRPA